MWGPGRGSDTHTHKLWCSCSDGLACTLIPSPLILQDPPYQLQCWPDRGESFSAAELGCRNLPPLVPTQIHTLIPWLLGPFLSLIINFLPHSQQHIFQTSISFLPPTIVNSQPSLLTFTSKDAYLFSLHLLQMVSEKDVTILPDENKHVSCFSWIVFWGNHIAQGDMGNFFFYR